MDLSAFGHSADAVFAVEVEGTITLWNPAAERLFGYPAHEVLGRPCWTVIAGQDLDGKAFCKPDCRIRMLAKQGEEPGRFPLVVRTKAGQRVWLDASIISPKGSGTVVYLVRDASAEHLLRESERRYRLLAESATDVIWTADMNLVTTYVSPSVTRCLGYSVAELVGQPVWDLLAPESADVARSACEEAVNRERMGGADPLRSRTLELKIRCRDGSTVWSEVKMAFLRNEEGQPVGVLGVARDVSERKQAEEEIERQRQALYQAEKLAALGELLAGVAHELNNPLSVVIGQATMLRGLIGGGPLAERAEKITRAAERCARIMKNFLALARQSPPERQQVSLNQVVQEAVELLAYPLRMDNVEVMLDLDADLPTIWADPYQFHQVLVNLIANAHDALRRTASPRRLTLTTRSDPTRDHVTLAVADTGPGIPREIQLRVFDPFFTTKPLGQGTGLGLSLCHGIVENHGGTIRVKSQPGKGAVFTITLPVQHSPAGSPPVQAFAELPPVRGKAILVVDDEVEVAACLEEALALDGHRVDTAADGVSALEKLRERTYDLILTDLRMPGLDGPGLYREVQRRHPELSRRFVFLTGDALSPDTQRFLELVRAPVLNKPFALRDLREVIRQAFALLRESP